MKNPSLGQVFKLRSGDKHPIQSGALIWTLCTQRNGVQICSNQFCCCLACIRFHTHEAMPRHCQDLILRGHHWPKIETSALLTVHLHRYAVHLYIYIYTHICVCVYVRVSVSVCVCECLWSKSQTCACHVEVHDVSVPRMTFPGSRDARRKLGHFQLRPEAPANKSQNFRTCTWYLGSISNLA